MLKRLTPACVCSVTLQIPPPKNLLSPSEREGLALPPFTRSRLLFRSHLPPTFTLETLEHFAG